MTKLILEKVEWKWKLYEEWKVKFEERNMFPAFWESIGLIDPIAQKPKSVEEAFTFWKMKDLRAWLTSQGKCPKPFPKKREDLFEWSKKNIAWKEIEKYTDPFYQDYLEKQTYWRKQGRADLLASYLAGVYATYSNVEEFKKNGWKYEPLPGSGDVLAEEMSAKYRSGKIKNLPPYYPGDFTPIVPARTP